jgi:hypothetical protein
MNAAWTNLRIRTGIKLPQPDADAKSAGQTGLS